MQLTAQPGTGSGGGMPGRSAERDAEFTAYLAARQPALLRTAYLLTGDQHQAEDVLQTSLAKLYLAWDRVRDRDSVDAYVRRIMVNENNSLWRRAWKRREHPTDELPEGAPVLDTLRRRPQRHALGAGADAASQGPRRPRPALLRGAARRARPPTCSASPSAP